MAKKLIKHTKTDHKSSLIVPSNPLPQPVSFNFKSLKIEGRKFNYEDKDVGYFCKVIERLKGVSPLTKMELVSNRSDALRFHRINFKDRNVSEKTFGIGTDEVDDEAYQITISANEHGRLHGYFVGSIFYIVWFDPKHELYSRR